jgi:serine/threonine protein kinase
MTHLVESGCLQCGGDAPANAPLGLCLDCFQASTMRLATATKPATTSAPSNSSGLTLAAGLKLAGGRFRLLEPLGEGGMGVVWLAEDEQLSHDDEVCLVALKFLSPTIRDDPEALALLKREVLQSRRLNHPNIIRIFDWHEHRGEPVFFSMEYVAGCSVETLRQAQPAGMFAWSAIATWVRQLCSALEYAHSSEAIVHRDLKPGNLMVTWNGVLKLADFGLARPAVRRNFADSARTTVKGTPLFMGPEQMAGALPAFTDDIYSFGATLYLLLSGTPPYESTEQVFSIHRPMPEPLTDRLIARGYSVAIPTTVKVAVMSCLNPDPALRPARIRDVAGRLFLHEDHPSTAPRQRMEDWAELAAPESTGRAMWWWALVFVALASTGAVFIWLNRRPDNQGNGSDNRGKTNASAVVTNRAVIEKSEAVASSQSSLLLRLTNVPAFTNMAFIVANEQGKMLATGAFQTATVRLPLDPGAYVAEVHQRTSGFRLRRDVQVGPGEASANFDFALGHHRIYIRFPNTEQREQATARGISVLMSGSGMTLTEQPSLGSVESAYFNGPFWPAGDVMYQVVSPGWHTVNTNFPVRAGRQTDHYIQMVRDLWPVQGQPWTNSLGLTFLGLPKLWVARTETPQRAFEKFAEHTALPVLPMISVTNVGATNVGRTWMNPWPNLFPPRTTEHPVVGIPQEAAASFCRWLTERDRAAGYLSALDEYRLPTVAEWEEIAAGASASLTGANFCDRAAAAFQWPAHWPHLASYDGFARTAPVHHGEASAGIFQLAGNVAEWCRDVRRHEGRTQFAAKGGSWFDGDDFDPPSRFLRAGEVQWFDGQLGHDRVGFRMILVRNSAAAERSTVR